MVGMGIVIGKMMWFMAMAMTMVGCHGSNDKLLNASFLEMFVDDLPDMPKLHAYALRDGTPSPIHLTIGMYETKWKFHRDLSPTPVFAFGTSKGKATVPGPTIEALVDIPAYITWENHLPAHHILSWDPTIPIALPASGSGVPTVVHLHGGIHHPQSDGNSNSWFTAGFRDTGPAWTNKTYVYANNQQPGNLWYHDHALGLTRVNLLAGLLGAYILRHPSSEVAFRLPSAPFFDRPLVIFDRSFTIDGSIFLNSTGNNPSIHPQWQPEYFGSAILVNGKAWPYASVEKRRYRFRIINACNARFLHLYFVDGKSRSGRRLQFVHLGSDSAYIGRPVRSKHVLIAPSEIADVVVDFSESRSDSVILANDAPYPFPTGDRTDALSGTVMKFSIRQRTSVDQSRIPSQLMNYPAADPLVATTVRHLAMYEYTTSTDEPTHLYINAMPYEAPVTETPRAGTSEIWEFINLTGDNHPLHIHLGLITALEQRELVDLDNLTACMNKWNDFDKCHVSDHARGKLQKVPRHERGWKNVFKMRPGYLTRIFVRFSLIHVDQKYPFDATEEPGYVYHCHILDHEDNVMMRPLKLVP
ncbi:multicopper oxidase LPR1 [Amborella trichopoda]|nr:multicopper oxidase LPR1 [Amborella trichopoda]|eukprot:XP_006845284.2 multicopper oxidase LPR1 [Amborella trichopoda]